MPKAKARKAISKTTRFEVFKRDQFTCQYCGAHPPAVVLQVDHIVAVAKGGANEMDNFVTSCQPCNIGKGVRGLTAVPQSMADRAAETAEREAQILGYQAVMAAKRDRLDDEAWRVIAALEGEEPEFYAKDRYRSVRMFIERIGFDLALDCAEAANSRAAGNPFRYFCALCWGRLKGWK